MAPTSFNVAIVGATGAVGHQLNGLIENNRIPAPLTVNVVPQTGDTLDNGLSLEEQKIAQESRKILELPNRHITATCVRVPVINGRSDAVYVECRTVADPKQFHRLVATGPSVRVYGTDKRDFPTPRDLHSFDDVHVGRIWPDPDNSNAFWMWVVPDNLHSGAAINAIQVAEVAVANGMVLPA